MNEEEKPTEWNVPCLKYWEKGKEFCLTQKQDYSHKCEERLTRKQQKALHLYLRQVSEALNDAGLTIQEVLKFTFELEWTEEAVKEILWRTAQKKMFGKESTTQLSKQKEIDMIYETMNRFLGEKLHIESISFPSQESLSLEALTK